MGFPVHSAELPKHNASQSSLCDMPMAHHPPPPPAPPPLLPINIYALICPAHALLGLFHVFTRSPIYAHTHQPVCLFASLFVYVY